MKALFLTIALAVCVSSATWAQSDKEIAYRDKLLVEWKKDGIQPLTGPSADGTQNLAVLASGWYFPLSYTAKAGVKSVLRVYTNKTYDCSRALMIPELNLKKSLPATGFVEIAVPAKKKGEVLYGTCSMGMYTFKIRFE